MQSEGGGWPPELIPGSLRALSWIFEPRPLRAQPVVSNTGFERWALQKEFQLLTRNPAPQGRPLQLSPMGEPQLESTPTNRPQLTFCHLWVGCVGRASRKAFQKLRKTVPFVVQAEGKVA